MPSPPPVGLLPDGSPALNQKGEHRQVTVLVADMVGFTAFVERAGEEAAYALMGHISSLMTAAVHQHRGSVKSFTGDGIMALFGAPVALEDGPLKACRAALEIQERLADARSRIEAEIGLRPQLRIGITTGPVVLGTVDSGESTNVTAYGDVVNLAARLQAEAVPGTVVMTEAMLRRVEGMVESELAGVFRFKGKSEPQAVYRLLAVREHATRFDAAVARGLTSYIGRNRELAVLEKQLQDLNSVRVVDIVGDPGIGKSRLLYEFSLRHSAEQLLILRGNCSADGQETPFLPFIEVVRASFSVSSGEAEAAIVRKLDEGLKRLGRASQQNLGLLLNLLGLEAPQGALSRLDGTLIGTRTRDLLLQLLEAQCRGSPVVLLLEDLHWIDSASEELLLRIVDGEKSLPLIVLHTRRPEYRPAWVDRSCVAELRLAPLSSSETLRIAQIRLGVDRLPESLARLVVEKAEGNALFVEEIARFLIERGTVRRTPLGLVYDESTVAAALPASVQSLLTARVDRLSSEDRDLLQIAAVIGRRFDPKLLAVVANVSGSVEQRLDAIEALDLVQRDQRSEDYEFKHVLVRDALYHSLVSSQRAELHRKVANAIELRGATRISEVAETLAHHFSCSARHDKAFHYLSLSGRKCLDIYSLEEAESYFRKALNILGAVPSCADNQAMATVVANLLEVLYLKGDLLRLREIAESYIPRLQALGDTPQLVFALYFHIMLLEHHCDFRAAEARANLALDIAQRLGDIRAQAYAYSALLFCSTILGRHSLEVAEREGARVLEICTRAGDNYILNWAYWSIAWDYVCRGLTKRARTWTLKLIEAGQKRQDNRALGMAYWTLAWIDIQDLRYGDAIANAQKCLKAAATPFDRTAGTMASATGLLLEGRFDEGLAQLLALKKWALANGWLYSASGVDFAAGPALAATGRIAEGIRMLESGIAACDASGSRAMASWNRLSLAEIYLHMLLTRERPSIKLILANFGAIGGARMFGVRRTRLLLGEASQNEQLHESGTTRCRIEMDFAKLYRRQKRADLARAHLQRARLAAAAQDSPLLAEIDAISQSLT
jgi:class 3 adenylate cyclase